jgi:hypothetical protein
MRSFCHDSEMICLIGLLNEFESWLAMECENVLASSVGQLRRRNVEGTAIQKTAKQKNVALAETEGKMKVLSALLRRNRTSSW